MFFLFSLQLRLKALVRVRAADRVLCPYWVVPAYPLVFLILIVLTAFVCPVHLVLLVPLVLQALVPVLVVVPVDLQAGPALVRDRDLRVPRVLALVQVVVPVLAELVPVGVVAEEKLVRKMIRYHPTHFVLLMRVVNASKILFIMEN